MTCIICNKIVAKHTTRQVRECFEARYGLKKKKKSIEDMKEKLIL